MKRILDITVRLGPDTPLFPGDPMPQVELLSSIEQGDDLTASLVRLPAHAGTHVDLPGHFIKGGRVLGDYSIEDFVGPAWVLDLSDVDTSISTERLSTEHIPRGYHLLIKTRNSRLLRQTHFRDDYVHLDPLAAGHLLNADPLSLGFDYYSLDPGDSARLPAHRRCAEAGIPVFVCLDLAHISAGPWQFCGLPLSIPCLEGAPVRAIVWRDDQAS